MSLKDKEKWNDKYSGPEFVTGRDACDWLIQNRDLLSGKGQALDIASGEGRNSVYAAAQGYEVLAIDVSETGMEKAESLAKEKNLNIRTLIADLDGYSPEENAYDLILCFNFLNRRLFPEIRRALKPGGLVFYETFTTDYLKYSGFKREWVLEPNELLREFQEFRVLRYRDVDQDPKAFASIVARKLR